MNENELVIIEATKDLEQKLNNHFSMYSLSTQKSYLSDMTLYLKVVGLPSVQATKVRDVVYYINELEKMNYSNSTFNRKLYSLSKVIDVYIINGLMESNPVKQLRLVKKLDKNVSKAIELNISLNDVKKVIEISKPKPSLIISFLTTSGLRLSELLNIKYTDIEFFNDEYCSIKIYGKGDKERKINIKKTLIDDIKKHFKNSDCDLLFHSKNGNQLLRQNTYNQIKKQFALIGKNVNPHKLRHLYINTQINVLGKEIKATSLYVGHSSVNITLDFYCNKKLACEDSNLL